MQSLARFKKEASAALSSRSIFFGLRMRLLERRVFLLPIAKPIISSTLDWKGLFHVYTHVHSHVRVHVNVDNHVYVTVHMLTHARVHVVSMCI